MMVQGCRYKIPTAEYIRLFRQWYAYLIKRGVSTHRAPWIARNKAGKNQSVPWYKLRKDYED